MGCDENFRCRQAYGVALRAWNLNHSSFFNGSRSMDASSLLRRELLGTIEGCGLSRYVQGRERTSLVSLFVS
jgi:hypothetical protein